MADLDEIAERLAGKTSFQRFMGREVEDTASIPIPPGDEIEEDEEPDEIPETPEEPQDEDSPDEDAEAQDEQDVSDDDEVTDSDRYTVTTADGEQREVTVEDLITSYQKAGNVNRKLTALDVDKKAFEKEREEAQAKWEQRLNTESQALDFVKSQLLGKYAGVDWNNLRSTDPQGFQETWNEYQYDTALINEQITAHQAKLQEQQKAQQKKAQEWIDKQAQLAIEQNDWADETARKSAMVKIKDHLQKDVPGGFRDDEIAQLVDSRYVWLVNRSARLAELEKAQPSIQKKVRKAPKVLKSAGRTTDNSTDEVAKLQARYKKSGKIEDLTALRLARKKQRA